MADKKPYLVVNYDAMTFTVNDAEKPTAQDEADIARFLRAGFKMRHKSAKRTDNATKNALTDDAIMKAFEEELKDAGKKAVAEQGKAEYIRIKKDNSKNAEGKRNGGFFKAKAWYVNTYVSAEHYAEVLEEEKKKKEEEKKAKK